MLDLFWLHTFAGGLIADRSRMSPMSNEHDWPDELDALHAAPKYHGVLFENEFVRVLDTRIPAGESVPLHTHRWPSALYILSWSDFLRRDAEGVVLMDSRTLEKVDSESAVWLEPLPPHTLENVGAVEFRAISVEVKRKESAGPKG